MSRIKGTENEYVMNWDDENGTDPCPAWNESLTDEPYDPNNPDDLDEDDIIDED